MLEIKRNIKRSNGNLLSKNLRAYNKVFTGETQSEVLNIYVFESDELVGYCQTETEWNWVYITEIFYNDMNVLSELINQTSIYFADKVEGISYASNIKSRVDEFKSMEFAQLVALDNMPENHTYVGLINTSMSKKSCQKNYVVKTDSQEDISLKNKIKESIVLDDINNDKVEIMFDALDAGKFVGGVYGYIQYEYLYISTFWVSDSYRGQGIGSKLIKEIEKAALDEGIKNIYLETVTFQAREFYEKIGYEKIASRSNCPKGYEDFTMIKILN